MTRSLSAVIVATVVGFSVGGPRGLALAGAEWYVAGQGGHQFPQDLSDIQGTGRFQGTTSNDLNLRNQWAFGVKAGAYLPAGWQWLGMEFDFSHSDANIERQPITASAPLLGTTQQNGVTSRVGLTVNQFTLNLLARYPGQVFQPYLGIGGGLGHSLLRTSPERETAVYPVVNVLAGMKFFLTPHVACFTEYKHARATVEFADNPFKADLRTNWVMVGLAYHF